MSDRTDSAAGSRAAALVALRRGHIRCQPAEGEKAISRPSQPHSAAELQARSSGRSCQVSLQMA